MLTRRELLTGTAASSIAAIATAHGVEAAAADAHGFDIGFGNLQNGAAAVFYKEDIGFSYFFKLRDSVAQLFYKEQIAGQIDIFLKYFPKGDFRDAAFQKISWTLVDSFGGFLKDAIGAEAGFYKVNSSLAQIFLKYEGADQAVLQDVRTLEGGVLLPSENSCGSSD